MMSHEIDHWNTVARNTNDREINFRVVHHVLLDFKCFTEFCISFIRMKGLIQQIESTMTTHANVSHLKMPGLSKQYLQIKSKYPDFIVLFQVGDFYEIYSDDAIKVAEKTSLRISRNPNVNKLMAGFPVRSLDSWLTTLVQQGFQLAICPQQPSKWVQQWLFPRAKIIMIKLFINFKTNVAYLISLWYK